MENIIMIGFMGAGKTTVGAEYAKRHRRIFLDTDSMIEKMAGMTISEIFDTQGEAEFRRIEATVLEKLFAEPKGTIISVGGGLPLRRENRQMLKKLGIIVYMEVSPETVLLRLKGDTTRPLLKGEEAAERVKCMMSERDPIYREVADIILDVNRKTKDKILAELDERMGEYENSCTQWT